MSASFENQEEQLFSETTEKETDKKCPNCGATVVFDPKTGTMHCEYCGYSCELPEGWESAQKKIQFHLRSDIASYVRKQWRADRTDSVKFSTLYSNITYKYLLVPTWISSFKYNDKVYQFVVNGQTGKVGGKAPVSALRVLLTILIGIGIIAGLYFLLKK